MPRTIVSIIVAAADGLAPVSAASARAAESTATTQSVGMSRTVQLRIRAYG